MAEILQDSTKFSWPHMPISFEIWLISVEKLCQSQRTDEVTEITSRVSPMHASTHMTFPVYSDKEEFGSVSGVKVVKLIIFERK